MRILSVFMLGLFFVLQVSAQDKRLTGKVIDESGKPIPKVSVITNDGVQGVATDEKGEFSIIVSPKAKTLVFTAVDFGTREVTLGSETNFNVTLINESKTLGEVVINVPYGTTRKRDFTGSASTVTAKEIQNRPLTSVTTALLGTAPGVSGVTANGQPGSAPAIRIRGFGSISASSDPLYVVDGVPYTSNINNINMDDVDNISVLKDAATTSLYGSRAANGVVMITTKKGRKGRSSINVKVNTSITDRAIPDYERVGANDYYVLEWEALRNSLAYRATNPLSLDSASKIASGLTSQRSIVDELGYNPYNLPKNDIVRTDGTLNPNASVVYRPEDMDWFGPISRTGIRNEYSINFSGAMEKTDHFVSFAYLKEDGYINRSNFERFNARANVNSQLTNWLKIGTNLQFAKSTGNFASTDGSNDIVNPFFFAARMAPIYPIYAYDPARPGEYILDVNGNKQYDYGDGSIPTLPLRALYAGRHTIHENELSKQYFNRNVFNGRAYTEFTIMSGLKFTMNLAADYTNRYDLSYQNNIVGDGAPSGRSTKDYQTLEGATFNQILNYTKQWKDHNFEAFVAHENYRLKEDYLNGQRQVQIAAGIYELSNFTTPTAVSSQEDNVRIESYFTNFRYNFREKFYFTLGGRTDGSSRFGPNVRWGRFWSTSGAWVLTKENFMSNARFVNFLKLRASYGTTGNEAGISYYAWQSLYNNGRNNASAPGFQQSTSFGNDSLTWESNKQFDVGVDFTVWDNRINGTIEYFNRVSDNLLFNVPVPSSSGYANRPDNVGSMYNRGFEMQLAVDIIRTKDVVWNVGFNVTRLKNEITKLPQEEIITGTKKYKVGQSIQEYWLRSWYGVDPNDGAALFLPNPGTANRMTAKGDSVTTNQNNALFQYQGSAIPDWYGGLTTSVRYKSFTLSTIMYWQIGGKTYDDVYASYMHSGTYGVSLHKDMLNRWQKPGDVTNVPRMDNAQQATFGATSSRFLTDASFLNIQNITFSWEFPGKIKDRNLGFRSGRLYLSAENVKMFTKRAGMNPGQAFSGVTSVGYIPQRVLNIGVNVTF